MGNLHHLKELDLSYCPHIDEWYMDRIQDLPLICLMLLDVIPGLKIMGAEYMDITLLEGTEHEYLLADDGSVPRVEAGPMLDICKDKEEEQASTVRTTKALNE